MRVDRKRFGIQCYRLCCTVSELASVMNIANNPRGTVHTITNTSNITRSHFARLLLRMNGHTAGGIGVYEEAPVVCGIEFFGE